MAGKPKPTPADIAVAIAKAESGDWIDPVDVPFRWSCHLYDDVHERHVGDGDAHTPNEAMALAWLSVHAPDALSNAYVEPGSVPYDVPDEGWHFELTPPWRSKRD
jgi:hypothetical protein